MPYTFSTRFPYVKKKSNIIGPEFVQKVIIPQGLINPHKTTIIEIPDRLQNIPTIVAKVKDDTYNGFCPIKCSTIKDSHLFPKAANASASLGSSQYSISGSSRSTPVRTRTFIETAKYSQQVPPDDGAIDACPCGCTELNKPKAKSFPRDIHEAGATYGDTEFDYLPHKPRSFCKNCMQDYVPVSSHYGPILECSAYRNFEPPVGSTAHKIVQSAESFLNSLDYPVNQQLCQALSVARKQSGAYYTGEEPEDEDMGLRQVLDQLDEQELSPMQKNLRNVQAARRKLIYEVSNIKH